MTHPTKENKPENQAGDWEKEVYQIAISADYANDCVRLIKKVILQATQQAREEELRRVVGLIDNLEAPSDSEYDLEALHEGYFQALDDIITLLTKE